MSKKSIPAMLDINMNSLVHTFLREFVLCCRKSLIYGPNHPTAVKGMEKPFFVAEQIFEFKKYININIRNSDLYILNIRTKDSVFTDELVKYMQVLEVNSILLENKIAVGELNMFVGRLVKRVDLSDHSNILSSFLDENKIYSIEVNSNLGSDMFDKRKKYRGDVDIDLSLKNIILKDLPDNIVSLAELCHLRDTDEQLDLNDYNCEFIEYILPEKISMINPDEANKASLSYLDSIREKDKVDDLEHSSNISQKIYRLLDFHPKGKDVIEKLDNFIAMEYKDANFADSLKTPTARVKFETVEAIENQLNSIFNYEYGLEKPDEFITLYKRLLLTRQEDKAKDISTQLVGYLSDSNASKRQNALELLSDIVKIGNHPQQMKINEEITRLILIDILERKETFEYSEIIWSIISQDIKLKNYRSVDNILKGLLVRRQINDSITIYDSYAVKKVFHNLGSQEIISALVDDLVKKHKDHTLIREILIAINSNEVAMELSKLVSHPERYVRQQTIRILSELGKESLMVFSNILSDDRMFNREDDRRELPDNKWYIVRNSIYILGLLKDPQAIVPLRIRMNDPDFRVRREIVTALEKIGGEDAVDVLMMMTDDSDREIAESAVITIGIIGDHSVTPLLVELIRTSPRLLLKSIAALGRVGSVEGEKFLASLLLSESQLAEYTSGNVSKDDAKVAIIKSLGQIGNQSSLKSLEEFKASQSTASKLLFKNSSVNKALEEILTKK